jgi:hypothetical protein
MELNNTGSPEVHVDQSCGWRSGEGYPDMDSLNKKCRWGVHTGSQSQPYTGIRYLVCL